MADDGYTAYYQAKLWSLLPSIYRTLDPTVAPDATGATPNGPLREIVDRIGATAAVLRRSIDRMWEDQSIESCDDWVIPYIAAQLAVNLTSGMSARQQRLDVANAIYYRQRKGTVAILEEIASDVTGWEARVVQTYQRLGRARHGLDPAIGWPLDRVTSGGQPSLPVVAGLVGSYTGTQAGGYADLRSTYGASRAGTAFDELSYTLDVRLGSGPGGSPDVPHGEGRTGFHNIGTLAVFVWRLLSVRVDGVTPVEFDGHPNRYTFDPTGRDVQLFAPSAEAWDAAWVPRAEQQLPSPIDRPLLAAALSDLYGSNGILLYEGDPPSPIVAQQITADPHHGRHRYLVDPTRGHVHVPSGAPVPSQVAYRYGFSSSIGAGGYDRLAAGPGPVETGTLTSVVGGGAALASITAQSGIVEIGDSLTYSAVPSLSVAGSLVVRAKNQLRPLLRLPAGMSPATWVITGTSATSALVLDGLFVSGGDVVLAGTFDTVTISSSTLDPGTWDASAGAWSSAADGRPLVASRLIVAGNVRCLTIERSILGPVVLAKATDKTPAGSLGMATISDTIVQAASPADGALALATATVDLARSTVLGTSSLYRVEASDTIFHDVATAADVQRGCVRYSAWPTGSALPRQYQSVEIAPRQPLFASTAFGRPDYAALLAAVDPSIGAGADNGSEMGAFSSENNPLKERSLLLKYQEQLPVGLAPVLIYVT